MTARSFVRMTLAWSGLVCVLATPARADGQFTVGSQWWSQTVAEAKFQEFREVPRGGFLENFVWREWSGRNSLALWGSNALRHDQAANLTLANGARWRMDLGYLEIPHTFSQVARSPFVQSAPGLFTLPDTLQARNQANSSGYTSRMSDLLNNSPVVPLTFRTNVSTARLRARPSKGWQFEARGAMRERAGQKPFAMTFGFSTALEIPEPIDQRMVDADLIANYQRDRLRLQASGGISTFDNGISTLRVDNPKRITDVAGGDGPHVGALDLYPDNRVVRGSLALTYLMPRSSALAATIQVSRNTQDDPFLAPTGNTALPQSSLDSLPARSLDAKAIQLNGDLRFSTHPMDRLDAALRFHYSDYDNQTPELNFLGQAPYEVSWQRYIELRNHAFGNTQWVAGADLDYDVTSRMRVGGIAEFRVRERTEREVEKDDETVLGARARLRPWNGTQLEARYTRGDRTLDEFLDEEYEGLKQRAVGPTAGVFDSLAFLEQLALRRFDVASRVQDRVTAGGSHAFGERADLTANYQYLKNDYDADLGLQDETQHSVGTSGTFHLGERLDVDAGYGYDRTETNQLSRESGATLSINPLDNWTARLKDVDVYVSTGIDWTPAEKVSFSADYLNSRHLADFDLGNGRATAQDLPSTIYRIHDVTVEARYRWLRNTTIFGRYMWEDYHVDDWATNDVPLIFPVTGTANAIFFGDSSRGYRAHRIALLVRHQF